MSGIRAKIRKLMPRRTLAMLRRIRNRIRPRDSLTRLLEHRKSTKKTNEYRVKMTISCRDCGSIPKVPNAGEVQSLGGKEYQIMHNGLLVESGGYFGKWTETIIRELEGHHEPQEEKVFYEVLKLLQPGATMIELGSNWAYYSIWFNKCIPQGRNYCCEPNPESLKLGMRNAEANHCADIQFIQAAAGSDDGRLMIFPTGKVTVPIRSIDGIAREFGLEYVDIVHMDVQGAELDAIEGSVEAIQSKSVRFLFVSTHHYSISKDPLTHERCIALIEKLGGQFWSTMRCTSRSAATG